MRILVTGSTGFIGKNLIKKIKNDEVFLYFRGDDVYKSVENSKPDAIIHLAAEIYKDVEMFDSNIDLTYRFLKAAKDFCVKSFVYVGSSSEYGAKKKAMKETDLLEPRTMYEGTKGACTLLCQAFSKAYGLPVTIMRPFSLYGKDEPQHRLIPTLIRKMKKNETVEISFGSHDFIYIDDFLYAIKQLVKNPTIGEIYNFGTGVQYSNIEVAEIIKKLLNSNSRIIEIDRLLRPYDSDCWVADSTKARKELGWIPKHSLIEGLRKII
jgi:nucleoside-diphosphate-sugar epimerase